jgi:hypothetical protein
MSIVPPNACATKIPYQFKIDEEPQLLAWDDYSGVCGGNQVAHEYNTEYNYYDNSYDMDGTESIDALWVPPHAKVTLCSDKNNCNSNTNSILLGINSAGSGTNSYPGLYSDNFGRNTGKDDIDILTAERVRPWKEHLMMSCNNEITGSKALRGGFEPASDKCKELINTLCTNDEIGKIESAKRTSYKGKCLSICDRFGSSDKPSTCAALSSTPPPNDATPPPGNTTPPPGNTTPPPGNESGDKSKQPPPKPEDTSSSTWIYVLVFIFIVVMAIVGYFVFSGPSYPDYPNEYQQLMY